MKLRPGSLVLLFVLGVAGCSAGDGERPADKLPAPGEDEEPNPPVGGRGGTAGGRAGGGGGGGGQSGGAGSGGMGGSSAGGTGGGGAGATGGGEGGRGGGGTTADGGAVDAGPGARPPGDGGGSVPGLSEPCKYALCESFETLNDGAYPSNRVWRSGSATRMLVDSTRAARGKKSMKITTSDKPSETYLRETATLAQTGNAFHGRLYVYIDKQPTDFVHWNLIEVRGSDGKRSVRHGGIGNGGNNNWLFNVETHGNGEKAQGGPKVPTKTWMCVEWFFDGDKNTSTLWVDGAEKLSYKGAFGASYAFLPPFRSVHLGWALFQDVNAGYEIYIDELVIDKAKIGCEM